MTIDRSTPICYSAHWCYILRLNVKYVGQWFENKIKKIMHTHQPADHIPLCFRTILVFLHLSLSNSRPGHKTQVPTKNPSSHKECLSLCYHLYCWQNPMCSLCNIKSDIKTNLFVAINFWFNLCYEWCDSTTRDAQEERGECPTIWNMHTSVSHNFFLS